MKKYLISLSLLLNVGCGGSKQGEIEIDEKKIEMDADRLCTIVASTPRFQAREEYIKGYYNILDKYGLSQDSKSIQETFDGMTEILAIGSICKIKTVASIREAI